MVISSVTIRYSVIADSCQHAIGAVYVPFHLNIDAEGHVQRRQHVDACEVVPALSGCQFLAIVSHDRDVVDQIVVTERHMAASIVQCGKYGQDRSPDLVLSE